MKTYKTAKAALKAAKGFPIVRIGGLYVVPTDLDLVFFGLTSVEIIEPSGRVGGHVTLKHLDRLQNANYAVPHEKEKANSRIFFKPEEKTDDVTSNQRLDATGS